MNKCIMSEMDAVNGMRYPKDEVFIVKDDIQLPNALNHKCEKSSTAMTNSVASALDDSTPSDSGVQLMDSMSSDMNESFMSNYGLDYDGNIPTSAIAQDTLTNESINSRMDKFSIDEFKATDVSGLSDVVMASANDLVNASHKDCLEMDEIAMTRSDIDNSNVDSGFLLGDQNAGDITDDMKTSICSTFDTDAIVFRRKVKKSRTSSTSSSGSSVKKRVSFHEDILKNTKTDNIHIEHGFITYKGHLSKRPHRFLRNSWCSQGQCDDFADEASHTCYYRNACSDVLDYGQGDVHDQAEIITVDNSGIFEYAPQRQIVSPSMHTHMKKAHSNEERTFYHCKCSDSNSSLESNDNENGNNDGCKRNDYSRTKSSSCDCIGQSNKLNNNGSPNMNENCYFSDPCMETITEPEFGMVSPKSVWCKELKPKSSCLKKSFRETEVIVEPEAKNTLKKFNVHQLPDVNHLFGSLKSMFTIPIPERGVPEGCEDLHNVVECIPESDSPMKIPTQHVENQKQSPMKEEEPQTPFGTISRSKRKPELSLFTIPFEEEMAHVAIAEDTSITTPASACRPTSFRNKFIVNCESTVFEHTGVFFENREIPDIPNSSSNCVTPQKATKSILSFSTAPLKQRISNLFASFRDTSSSTTTSTRNHSPMSASVQEPHSEWLERERQEQLQTKLKKLQEEQMTRSWNSSYDYTRSSRAPYDGDSSMTSSIISNSSDKNDSIMSSSTMSTSTNNTSNNQERLNERYAHVTPRPSEPSFSSSSSPKKKTQHLASPLRRKSATSQFDRSKLSPDLFCGQKAIPPNPMVLLNEEFDDLLTITTDIESNENDIEIVDYSTAVNEAEEAAAQMQTSTSNDLKASNQFLRPPSSKSSLINRFLRNVTQKKINDAFVKKNIILSNKYKEPPKHFSNLYVKVKKPIDSGLMADFNAEIAQEMEANLVSNIENVDDALLSPQEDALKTKEEFGVGVGEVSIDIFDINQLHILRDYSEKLVKVFKLYTGYNLQGLMTPVLVFLTNKTLYVTDLVRNRLCNRFVLPYSELDVILIGPHGNTVLLSNSARDMQQVLLAGGPYPADGLVSSLEMCARRAGATLPSIGQLTFDHLAPLQKFVNEHCSASRNDAWIYYAVVSVPANVLTHEDEPLGPNIKGPLMHRSLSFAGDKQNQPWMAGYFLLKAGVLYMFADSNKKLPSMVIALTDFKGARRAFNSARPHCFEIMLKTSTLQLAAPDEYVASEWLQAVVQSASGLFENPERQKTLGCTLIITSNHLITLREDFSSPLRRLNSKGMSSSAISSKPQREYSINDRKMSISTVSDSTFNDVCSNLSTPSRVSMSSRSSPMRSSQQSVRTNMQTQEEKSFSSISSIYGKNSGVEIKTCAALEEMISIRIPAQSGQWWCILEFSCQEVRECSDDMVVFFATNSDMRRFLSILESMWQTKNKISFPISTLPDDNSITNHGRSLFMGLNRSWEPLLSAALGFPQ